MDGGQVDAQSALRDPLLQARQVFRRGLGRRERLPAMGREQAGEFVAGSRDAVERVVVAPVRPGAVETTDRPGWRFGGPGLQPGRAGQRGGRRTGSLNKTATVHGRNYCPRGRPWQAPVGQKMSRLDSPVEPPREPCRRAHVEPSSRLVSEPRPIAPEYSSLTLRAMPGEDPAMPNISISSPPRVGRDVRRRRMFCRIGDLSGHNRL